MKGFINKCNNKIIQASAAFSRAGKSFIKKLKDRKDKAAELSTITKTNSSKLHKPATHKRRRKSLQKSYFGNFRPLKRF